MEVFLCKAYLVGEGVNTVNEFPPRTLQWLMEAWSSIRIMFISHSTLLASISGLSNPIAWPWAGYIILICSTVWLAVCSTPISSTEKALQTMNLLNKLCLQKAPLKKSTQSRLYKLRFNSFIFAFRTSIFQLIKYTLCPKSNMPLTSAQMGVYSN